MPEDLKHNVDAQSVMGSFPKYNALMDTQKYSKDSSDLDTASFTHSSSTVCLHAIIDNKKD